MSILASLIQTIYVNEDAIVREYFRREKQKDWDENESKSNRSFCLLENEILAETQDVNDTTNSTDGESDSDEN